MIYLGGLKLFNYIRTQVQQLPPFPRRALFMQPGLIHFYWLALVSNPFI